MTWWWCEHNSIVTFLVALNQNGVTPKHTLHLMRTRTTKVNIKVVKRFQVLKLTEWHNSPVVFLSCNLLFAKYICKPLHRELSWSALNIKETSFSAFSGNKVATCFYQLIAEEEDHTLGDELTPSHQAVQKREWVERIVEMLLVSFNFHQQVVKRCTAVITDLHDL